MSAKESGFSKEQLENFDRWWKQLSKRSEVSDVAGPPRITPPHEDDIPRFRPKTWPVAPEELPGHLEKYRKLALDLGAVDAKLIPTSDIPQDLRALYIGCLFPICRWLNTNHQCPLARRYPLEEMKEFFADYQYAVVLKVLPPAIEGVPAVGEIKLDSYYTMSGQKPPDKSMLVRNIIRLRMLNEMERRVRAAAFYDGHMMAAPVGSGPCLVTKCADIGTCPALKPAGGCRSVEVQPVGSGCAYVDYFTLARRLGWGELQIGGNCAFPEDVPEPDEYYNIGLVLIE